jgi:hypothetical protein
MEQPIQALDQIARERDRINGLHDAIAIIVAEIGQKDFALRDSILRRLRAEEQKMTAEHPPDERGMKHPWPVELSSLCDSIQHLGCKRPLAR